MDVIFTDLDGTLLDRESYSWKAAAPALDRLRHSRVPWILVTSKSRAEVEYWRRQLQNQHPFIVENGGAAFVPAGYFRDAIAGASFVDGYEVVEWGAPYTELVSDLRCASAATGCRVRSFADMSGEDVARVCELPLAQALLAKQRDYDEAFFIADEDRTGALLAAIARIGRNCVRGGRLWHITGGNDKATAVRFLSALYSREHTHIRTIGIGDGWNDLAFLRIVNVPALILSPDAIELQAHLPGAILSECGGPAGWNSVVLSLTAAGA